MAGFDLTTEALAADSKMVDVTTRHVGYEVSQRKRKRMEPSFGWMKMVGIAKESEVARNREGRVAAYHFRRLRKLARA